MTREPLMVQSSTWLATRTLWQREMVRFFRQRHRVIGALATPIVFWLVLGGGLNEAFRLSDQVLIPGEREVGYLEYFFPGTVVLILLFSAIFSTISVIEDRREGFLQGVLVSPAPRLAVVLGKVMGGATVAMAQGLLFLAAWPFVGDAPHGLSGVAWMLLAIAVMVVLSIGLTALGLCIAWPMDSTAGFHAIMNLFLMPMWFLSGAVFPLHSATTPIKVLMWLNPLMYGQVAFNAALTGGEGRVVSYVPLSMALALTLFFTVFTLYLAMRIVSRRRRDGMA